MSTNENGFLFTPGELTLPPGARHDGSKHGGVAILMSRIILDAEMSGPDKAPTICGHLKAAGLETNESVIRVINLSKSDIGRTDHQAIVILKPTGEEEEQLTYLCADHSMGTATILMLACGAIPPARSGMSRRAVASRLPFNGAPVETIRFFTGIILQSKPVLAQRLPILKDGLRQMVMEAIRRANEEQDAILAEHRSVIAAGVEASSPAVMAHAADSAEFSAEVVECLQLIPTEPESHYDINLTSLNSGAAAAPSASRPPSAFPPGRS